MIYSADLTLCCTLFLFPFGGRPKPDSDGCAENRLDDLSVKLDQQLPRQVVLPELEAGSSSSAEPFLMTVLMLVSHFRSWETVDPRNLAVM